MGHLNAEALARLVDHAPEPGEAEHLATCERCSAELSAYRRQTDRLAALPELVPPLGDWQVLEARLRSEGLVRDRGLLDRIGIATTPVWMKAAAAVLLFLGGTSVGATVASRGGLGGGGDLSGPVSFASATTVEEAARAVNAAEQSYVEALARYRLILAQDGASDAGTDPTSQLAALEYVVAAGQAAVRQAPADPFLNGILASALAEREATLRRISSRDNWF